MSATLKIPPPVIAFSQEPLQVTITTNNVTSARARLDIDITASPLINETLILAWAGKMITFVFKGNPNNSATELPIADPSVGIDTEYIFRLADTLMQHEWIADQFEATVKVLTVNTLWRITLTSRFDAPLTLTHVAPATGIVMTDIAAVSPYLKPNLTAILKVISRTGRDIAKLVANYRIERDKLLGWHGRTEFDLGSLFDVGVHLPSQRSLDSAFDFKPQVAFRAYTKYFLRFADKYGSVPVAESLYRAQSAWVIHGGRSVNSLQAFTPNAQGFYTCHPAPSQQVTRHQANFLYLFTTFAYQKVVVNLNLHTDAGTTIKIWSGSVFNLNRHRLYYFRTGFEQLSIKIAENLFNFKTTAYDWQIIDELTGDVKYTYRYELNNNCHTDTLYLAYSNGMGGVDTLAAYGGYSIKIEATRDIVHYTADKEDGVYQYAQRKIWDVQTGLITPQYADQLRQLLTGEIWLIDSENGRFLKMILDTKSVEIHPKWGGMVSLGLSFKTAHEDVNGV